MSKLKIIISGPPGSGKTTLAHTLHALLATHFPGRLIGEGSGFTIKLDPSVEESPGLARSLAAIASRGTEIVIVEAAARRELSTDERAELEKWRRDHAMRYGYDRDDAPTPEQLAQDSRDIRQHRAEREQEAIELRAKLAAAGDAAGVRALIDALPGIFSPLGSPKRTEQTTLETLRANLETLEVWGREEINQELSHLPGSRGDAGSFVSETLAGVRAKLGRDGGGSSIVAMELAGRANTLTTIDELIAEQRLGTGEPDPYRVREE